MINHSDRYRIDHIMLQNIPAPGIASQLIPLSLIHVKNAITIPSMAHVANPDK